MECCGAREDAHFHWCQQVGGPGFSGRQLQVIVAAQCAERRRRDREAARVEHARQLVERVASAAGRRVTSDMIDRTLALLRAT